MSKTQEQFFDELWGVVKGAARDLLDEAHTSEAVRALVEYAARAQFVIHDPASQPAVRELAEREFRHRTAHVEAYLPVLAIDAAKGQRIIGILESLFGLLLKFGPALL